eukprot:6202293-Pleurochrysis_carterae.AAC.1
MFSTRVRVRVGGMIRTRVRLRAWRMVRTRVKVRAWGMVRTMVRGLGLELGFGLPSGLWLGSPGAQEELRAHERRRENNVLGQVIVSVRIRRLRIGLGVESPEAEKELRAHERRREDDGLGQVVPDHGLVGLGEAGAQFARGVGQLRTLRRGGGLQNGGKRWHGGKWRVWFRDQKWGAGELGVGGGGGSKIDGKEGQMELGTT